MENNKIKNKVGRPEVPVNTKKERREVHLDSKTVELLQIQAIQTGHKNLKRYAEYLLTKQANNGK